jgi:hypothetical protein
MYRGIYLPIHSTPSLMLTQNSTVVNPDLIGACIYLLLCFQMVDFFSACFVLQNVGTYVC